MDVEDMIEALKGEYGGDEWWPSESVFEVIVGAILTQRVSWKNCRYGHCEPETRPGSRPTSNNEA